MLDVNGTGYYVHISLFTYSALQDTAESLVFVHQLVREDQHSLYGFATKKEREIFRFLLGVSGIGANTARMMLSSQTPTELENAILTGNVAVLKGIKGIGLKTAQRVIIDLKDKLGKSDTDPDFMMHQSNTVREESLSALVALGFVKKAAEKTIDAILTKSPEFSVEDLVKQALKQM